MADQLGLKTTTAWAAAINGSSSSCCSSAMSAAMCRTDIYIFFYASRIQSAVSGTVPHGIVGLYVSHFNHASLHDNKYRTMPRFSTLTVSTGGYCQTRQTARSVVYTCMQIHSKHAGTNLFVRGTTCKLILTLQVEVSSYLPAISIIS